MCPPTIPSSDIDRPYDFPSVLSEMHCTTAAPLSNNTPEDDYSNSRERATQASPQQMPWRISMDSPCSNRHYVSDQPERKIRKVRFPLMDQALCAWVYSRMGGKRLTGAVIKRKASELLKEHYPESNPGDLTFSNGWLRTFQNRHQIETSSRSTRQIPLQPRTLPIVSDRMNPFHSRPMAIEPAVIHRYEQNVSEKPQHAAAVYSILSNYPWDQIFVVSGGNFFYDSYSFDSRLSFICCVDGSGKNKLPLWVIAPQNSKICHEQDIERLARLNVVVYRQSHSPDASITPEIVRDWLVWFDEQFLRRGGAMRHLLIHNSEIYLFASSFCHMLYRVKASFIAPNVTENHQMRAALELPVVALVKLFKLRQLEFDISNMRDFHQKRKSNTDLQHVWLCRFDAACIVSMCWEDELGEKFLGSHFKLIWSTLKGLLQRSPPIRLQNTEYCTQFMEKIEQAANTWMSAYENELAQSKTDVVLRSRRAERATVDGGQWKMDTVHPILSSVYQWFAERADLQQHKAILTELLHYRSQFV